MLRGDTAGSYDVDLSLTFWEPLHWFQSGWTSSKSHQQWIKVPFSPHPLQYLFFIFIILTGERWNFTIICLCLPPTPSSWISGLWHDIPQFLQGFFSLTSFRIRWNSISFSLLLLKPLWSPRHFSYLKQRVPFFFRSFLVFMLKIYFFISWSH